MTCKDCGTNVYKMACLNCAARHCRMMFYPPVIDRWAYVKAVAEKHGHEPRKLAEKVKELGSVETKQNISEVQGAGAGRQTDLF